MKLAYYPGCTMHEKAHAFEASGLRVFEILGFEMARMKEWYCCGAVTSLVSDNLMNFAAPFRNLALAEKEFPGGTLTTFCAACYNVLKNTQSLVSGNGEKKKILEDFVEEKYSGGVKVLHYLELLRDAENLKEKVKVSLKGLKVAPYYGCLLLRPYREAGIDDPENPSIMEDLISSTGAEAVIFPHRIECCGAHLSVTGPEQAVSCVKRVIDSARNAGADFIVNSCPLCQYNLDKLQKDMAGGNGEFVPLPVLYMTEMLAIALGEDPAAVLSGSHYIDPFPALAKFKNPPGGGGA